MLRLLFGMFPVPHHQHGVPHLLHLLLGQFVGGLVVLGVEGADTVALDGDRVVVHLLSLDVSPHHLSLLNVPVQRDIQALLAIIESFREWKPPILMP